MAWQLLKGKTGFLSPSICMRLILQALKPGLFSFLVPCWPVVTEWVYLCCKIRVAYCLLALWSEVFLSQAGS